jgi:hypothetical protein
VRAEAQRGRTVFASRSPSQGDNLRPRLSSAIRRPPVNGESLAILEGWTERFRTRLAGHYNRGPENHQAEIPLHPLTGRRSVVPCGNPSACPRAALPC